MKIKSGGSKRKPALSIRNPFSPASSAGKPLWDTDPAHDPESRIDRDKILEMLLAVAALSRVRLDAR